MSRAGGSAVRIAVGPGPGPGPGLRPAAGFAEEAVVAGGGSVVAANSGRAEGLVWTSPGHLDELRAVLAGQPSIRWVQLPFAGVEHHIASGLIDRSRIWTCAKGSYAQPVAEHAMMLALAGLRLLPARVVATSWGTPAGRSLYGADVTILGGGGIAVELLRLLAPFGVSASVVRRSAEPLPGAARTLPADRLDAALDGALVVFVALALTPASAGILDRARLRTIGPAGWVVNVARGGHIVTADLVAALVAGELGGAALDVTDPEPLPDGHPLWTAPNCIITPHTADTWEMVVPLLAERIRTNVARFAAGEPLVGVVDPVAGY